MKLWKASEHRPVLLAFVCQTLGSWLSCKAVFRTLFHSKENRLLLGVVAGYLVSGVANNVGAAMMGVVMPGYPAWLLYGTTIMYTILFFTIATIRGEDPLGAGMSKLKFKQYLWLALWTALNGLFFQFADPWVDGDLQQVCFCLMHHRAPWLSRLWQCVALR